MKENPQGTFYSTTIFIPAYTCDKEGLLISLCLKASPCHSLRIKTIGSLANSFEKIFSRAIFILASLKINWRCLEKFHFELTSSENFFNLKDARSASLSICIGLLNILRQKENKNPIADFVGTGILRWDGSFEGASGEENKKKATEKFFLERKRFLSSQNCEHVFELEEMFARTTK